MHRGIYEPGVAVGYALDPAPGRHTASNSGNASVAAFAPYFAMLGRKPAARYDYAEKGVTQAIAMSLYRAFDSLGLCQFALAMGQPPFLEWLNAAADWGVDEAEFYRIGRRIQVMRHAFNAKHGLPAQFPLPGRERGDPPQTLGPVANRTLDMEAMAAGYFAALGLDPLTGLPLPGRERGDPPQTLGPVANRTLDMEAMAAGYFAALGLDPLTGLPLPETAKELGLETILEKVTVT